MGTACHTVGFPTMGFLNPMVHLMNGYWDVTQWVWSVGLSHHGISKSHGPSHEWVLDVTQWVGLLLLSHHGICKSHDPSHEWILNITQWVPNFTL